MDEGKARKQVQRKQQAESLLQNELLQEAFDKLEREIVEGWKHSPADAEKGRENAFIMYRLLQNFKQQFSEVVQTGKLAEKELLAIKDKRKFFN